MVDAMGIIIPVPKAAVYLRRRVVQGSGVRGSGLGPNGGFVPGGVKAGIRDGGSGGVKVCSFE